jgi:hypothetical protein
MADLVPPSSPPQFERRDAVDEELARLRQYEEEGEDIGEVDMDISGSSDLSEAEEMKEMEKVEEVEMEILKPNGKGEIEAMESNREISEPSEEEAISEPKGYRYSSRTPITSANDEDEANEEIEGVVLHSGKIYPILEPAPEAEDEDEDDEDDYHNDTTHRGDVVSPPPVLFDEHHDTLPFLSPSKALELPHNSRASSEASTIHLDPGPSIAKNRPRTRSLVPDDVPGPSTTTLATTKTLGSTLQDWRYKDAVLPDELPQTIGQWAKLEQKVRMITPLPDATKPVDDNISEGFVVEVRKAFEELMVKDQKRVCEVVKKSWKAEGEDDDYVSCFPICYGFGKEAEGC